MDIKLVDNKGDNTLIQVLKDEVKKGSKMAVASAYFSIYAFEELKKELSKASDFRFLYTKPTFYQQEQDQNHQYQIKVNKENYPTFDGNDFEMPLRNKMASKLIAIEGKPVFKQRI